MSDIEIEQRGAVRRIRLNRPDKLNAITPEMFDGLFDAVDAAGAATETSVIVLSGAGRAFCAGADMKAAAAAGTAQDHDIANAPADMVDNRARVERYLQLWSCPKPVIAQVHGYCIGMANELVGAADLIVCGESAQIGMPEARSFALPPTLGMWPLRMGIARTKELLFTGRLLSGPEAVDLGLAIGVHPDDELEDEVDALADHIAEVPGPLLTVAKQAVNSWAETFGARTAAARGAEYHAIYHQASTWASMVSDNTSDA